MFQKYTLSSPEIRFGKLHKSFTGMAFIGAKYGITIETRYLTRI